VVVASDTDLAVEAVLAFGFYEDVTDFADVSFVVAFFEFEFPGVENDSRVLEGCEQVGYKVGGVNEEAKDLEVRVYLWSHKENEK